MTRLFVYLILAILFLAASSSSYAYDPLIPDNNKFGIHILFPAEIDEAAKLVNSQGGDWGYVTIPLPENDYDLEKWQTFMNRAKELHIIPIIRIATQLDPLNSSAWEKPDYFDVIDSANFLNSLDWPTKNRYVIVYNEVNRGDEWSGLPNPYEYADILSFAADTFHYRTPDFFVLSAGLDNAAPDAPAYYINQYTFLSLMEAASPGIFDKIDGLTSHSYPNPGFSSTPDDLTNMSIYSFLFERDLIQTFSAKKHPIFITETGWDKEKINDSIQAEYYRIAFEKAWSDPGIVAVTPFILNAGAGAFPKFSFLSTNGEKTKIYTEYQSIRKIKGKPILEKQTKQISAVKKILPVRNFSEFDKDGLKERRGVTKNLLKFLIGI